MSEPFWLAVNCHRSTKVNPGCWTAHWVKQCCGFRSPWLPGDEEGGYLTFLSDNYVEFEVAVLEQISRLKKGPHSHRYENRVVELSADCGTCRGRVKSVPRAVSELIDKFNGKKAQTALSAEALDALLATKRVD
ncbi:hypothetical protein [Achromobacter ruhlandii]|uniref:hypothetical protein n=1 Tax=Achromobacter ruhlandii TaxID=72557 RepID=UPI0012E81A45|nr:hypothetical protein [Achromobacter ruhlandii]